MDVKRLAAEVLRFFDRPISPAAVLLGMCAGYALAMARIWWWAR